MAGTAEPAGQERKVASPLSNILAGRREPSMGNLRKLLKELWWVDARELIGINEHHLA